MKWLPLNDKEYEALRQMLCRDPVTLPEELEQLHDNLCIHKDEED